MSMRVITPKKIITKIIFSLSAITVTMLQVTQFAVYFGNFFDRATNYLFTDSSDLFMSLPNGIGWWVSYLFGAVIMFGPIDYYCSMGNGEMIDLIVTILGIYFIAGFWIGVNMRHTRKPFAGFLLGMFSMIFFNIVVYVLATQLSILLSDLDTYGITSILQTIINSFLSGMYGENIATLIIRSALLNGAIFGVFGWFWTAVLMPPKEKKIDIASNIEFKCDLLSDKCTVPIDKFDINDVDINI